ncbi:LuxS/MPP-like metallohydrolase [Thelephora ganbajun]|uniref:LuxS/MPP-like metallohydrolase n=1 Tax=Thelephora ganbajun TaxID=370292 RepID=A0ACB6ZQ77_THEGA|nr:LuxS/MPP-like metallohydrolase [Thelephora ganbajun]
MVDATTGSLWQEHEAGYKVFVGSIEKPDLDERSYRILELKNGLRAVLVHDPLADKSAACLRVAVGSLYDPSDMYGTAHFCEHMITKGTRQFPVENDFVSFVKANGGLRNAGTSPSHTHYWFSIGPSSLLEAIPRLAAFFESPLFTPNVVAREINAVDSENKRNLQDDSRRVLQVERSLSAPGHPWLAFSTGNIDSLTSAARKKAIDEKWDSSTMLPDGDGGPVGRETRRRLIEWVEQQYCSGRMTLAILGQESLDTLTEITMRLFSSVPNRGLIRRPLIKDDPWTEDQHWCIILVKTIKDKYEFKLAFTIPYQSPQYLAKPASFLAHLIAHEGPGSIFSHLKNKGWLLSISAGLQTWNRGIQVFTVSGRLTLLGYCNYREVFRTIFSHIWLLRTSISSFPPYHEELKELSKISFRNREKSQPHTYVVSLTARLEEDSPTQWLLNADSLYREYSEEAVKAVLNCLFPERARITLSAKNHKSILEASQMDWQKEKWYGTEYSVQKFSPHMLEKVSSCPAVIPGLHLPPPNHFIPRNLEVIRDGIPTAPTVPVCILEVDSLRLWYKRDNTFWVPKGHAYVVLKSPFAEVTARHAVLTRRMVANLICDSLDEITYSASLAGLQYWLDYHSEGLSVCVCGYHDKLPLFLQVVLEKIKNLQPRVDRLEVFKEKVRAIRDYGNFPLQKPADHAGYYARYLVNTLQWTPEEKLPEVTGICVEEVQMHHASLLSRLYVEILVTGNFTDGEAVALAALVKEQLQYQALPPTEIPVPKSLVIPMGKSYTYRPLVTDPDELNCGLVLDFHLGDNADQDLRRKADFLRHLIDEPAFSTLRTKEQLGYHVATSRWTSVGTTALRFRIQSRKDPVFLEDRIEAFLSSFFEELKAMSDEYFYTRRRGLIVKKLEKAKNIAEEAADYWGQIRSGYYNFSLGKLHRRESWGK